MSTPETEFIHILGAVPGGSELTATRVSAKPLPEVLPILGLADIVIFPGMVAPLLVESAQSIRLIDDVVIGIKNKEEKIRALCLRLTPHTTAREQDSRRMLWLICWEVETPLISGVKYIRWFWPSR